MKYPSISIVIPTLNSAAVLEDCLRSVRLQDYPKDNMELLIADGGSKDKTIKIARKYSAKIYDNPLVTGEAGKAIGLHHTNEELIAFIDSDNILPERNWLQTMIKPFQDPRIILSEPISYTWRRDGGIVERYCALIGMNDPICLFIGNYDRLNYLTGKWTDIPHGEMDTDSYIKVKLFLTRTPTLGANGAIFRRSFLSQFAISKYFFDIDIIPKAIAKDGYLYIAKVKTGIIHTYCENSILKFIRKQKRRIGDFIYYKDKKFRYYHWQNNTRGIIVFVLSCIFIFPLIYQSIKGCIRKPDIVWIIHPLMCWITFVIYVSTYFFSILGLHKSNVQRVHWRQ